MAKLRIIYDNAANRAAISATNGTGAANLKNDYKGQVHRSSSISVAYTLDWASSETIGGLVLPATNLSNLATISATLTHSGGTATITNAPACPNTVLTQWQTSKTANNDLNANIFAYGGLSKTAIWFAQNYTGCTRLVITLSDNRGPYIDCARIVCGTWWEPTINVSRDGLSVGSVDSTKTTRSDAGDLLADQGFVTDELSFNLSLLTAQDRDDLLKIAKYAGISKSVAISVFPDTTNTNNAEQQAYLVYGKFDNANFDYVVSNYYSQNLKVTGW
jgi:hypothetical protein